MAQPPLKRACKSVSFPGDKAVLQSIRITCLGPGHSESIMKYLFIQKASSTSLLSPNSVKTLVIYKYRNSSTSIVGLSASAFVYKNRLAVVYNAHTR